MYEIKSKVTVTKLRRQRYIPQKETTILTAR